MRISKRASSLIGLFLATALSTAACSGSRGAKPNVNPRFAGGQNVVAPAPTTNASASQSANAAASPSPAHSTAVPTTSPSAITLDPTAQGLEATIDQVTGCPTATQFSPPSGTKLGQIPAQPLTSAGFGFHNVSSDTDGWEDWKETQGCTSMLVTTGANPTILLIGMYEDSTRTKRPEGFMCNVSLPLDAANVDVALTKLDVWLANGGSDCTRS